LLAYSNFLFLYICYNLNIMVKVKGKKIIKIFKIQFWVTVFIFIAYGAVIVIGGKDVFLSELNNKRSVAGASVSALIRIIGPPKKPLISISTACTAQGNSYVDLIWGSDEDSNEYDIYRGGEELMKALNKSSFKDLNVMNNNTYSYYVVAKGSQGTTISDGVSIKTGECPAPIIPKITAEIISGKNVRAENISEISQRKPFFQGKVNIPYAIINLEIHSSQIIYATVRANINGYWQWSSPVDISYGLHTLYIEAIDPNNPNIVASAVVLFDIIKDEEDDKKETEKKESQVTKFNEDGFSSENNFIIDSDGKKEKNIQQTGDRPLDFDISLENGSYIRGVNMAEEAYRGESIKATVEFIKMILKDKQANVSYSLINQDNKIVGQYFDEVVLSDGLILEKIISLPLDLELGKYKIRVSVTVDNTTVSQEYYFMVKDKPILKVGANMYISYNDFVSNLGWLFIFSTLFLFVFSCLALWEHHLCKQSLFYITEKFLKRSGFIN